ncbi:choice-of-anchor M domain-containing protein [Streptomyces sp. NPDC049879]|uniref:choice-of-anchor M domain-containing protein n=1 Tax=Streptomyces sp. NPDC049879 TaxID=3365598 RepID=UPI0037BD5E87
MNHGKRSRWRAAVAGTLTALLAAGGVGAARAAEPLVLDHGHIDAFHVSVSGDELLLDLTEDVTGRGVRHDPEDVVLKVKEQAWGEIPAGYPGAPAAYVLPLTQDPALIWPGWDTNATAASGYTDVTLDITDVEGPGTVSLHTLSVFGEPQSLLVGGGYELPGRIRESRPTHTHAQWVFPEAGDYRLTVRARATDPATGAVLTSGEETYHFEVGDAPAEPVGLSVTGLADSYRPGDPVELTAVPDGATDLDDYRWYTRASASDPWTESGDEDGAAYRGTARTDGEQVRAVLLDGDGEVAAESQPVTVHVEDDDGGQPSVRLTIGGLVESYRPGQTVELTAAQDPPGGEGDLRWSVRDPGGEWEAGAEGTAYAFEATEALDGRRVVVGLYDTAGERIAESAAVTVRVRADEEPPPGGGDPQTPTPPTDPPGTPDDPGAPPTPPGPSGQDPDPAPACYPVEEPSGEPGTSAPAGERVVLDHGHVDAFAVGVDAGELDLQLTEDVTGSHVAHEPEDVLLHVKQDAYTEDIPASYPGAPSGWLLPLTQDADLLWPGWDTNGTAGSDYTDVTIEITGVNGPGDVYLYSTTSFGGAAPLLEGGGYQLPGSLREETPAHTHAQWTFTEEGEYTLTVRAVATDPASGRSLTSRAAEYTFAVGELPDGADVRTSGAVAQQTSTVGRTADGEPCDLSDEQIAGGGGGSLAGTGSDLPPLALAAAVALLVTGAGGVLYARRRRAGRA